MQPDIAIELDGLKKVYRIYARPIDRLLQALMPRMGRLTGIGLRRHYFTEFEALQHVTLDVRRGESVGIVGRNGSGKSTLLQMVCGTLTPTAGRAQVNGRLAALLELGSGFNPEFTGRENVFMNASVLGLTREETEERFDRIVAFAEIGDFLDQPVKTYSSGMAMRLAFAVIANVDADVLVIDEALSVGDAMFQQKCFRWLREFQTRGTLLYCGHDTGAILGLCDRALWLHQGEVRMLGDTREVVEAYNIFVSTGQLSPPGAVVAATPEETAPEPAPVEEALPTEAPPPEPEPRAPSRLEMVGERSSYGSGDARITAVSLSRTDGAPFTWLEGGEELCLELRIEAVRPIHQGIAGFLMNNRLGQPLIGDNTVDVYIEEPVDMAAGQVAIARFRFRLPLLCRGPYTFSPAFASGTQEQHVQHHWIHDAVVIEVHPPRDVGALIMADASERVIEVQPQRVGLLAGG